MSSGTFVDKVIKHNRQAIKSAYEKLNHVDGNESVLCLFLPHHNSHKECECLLRVKHGVNNPGAVTGSRVEIFRLPEDEGLKPSIACLDQNYYPDYEDTDVMLATAEIGVTKPFLQGVGLGGGLFSIRDQLVESSFDEKLIRDQIKGKTVTGEIVDNASWQNDYGEKQSRDGWSSRWALNLGYNQVGPNKFRKVLRSSSEW